MYKRILVAVDGSRGARLALDEALKVAQAAGGTVEAVSVVEHAAQQVDVGTGFVDESGASAAATEAATTALEEANELFALHHVQCESRAIDAYGEPVATVLARAADACGADLIVMGTHGRSGMRRLLLGSVAESLLRATRLPVLLVRHDPNEGPIPLKL
jgi:nucleotide-binding universal stress UspA family protein